jgi:hypothetical protein
VLLCCATWQAFLERAFKQLRQKISMSATAGHRLLTAAGLDLKKRVRAAFNRCVGHAHAIHSMAAAVGFWHRQELRGAFFTMAEHSYASLT